MTEPARGLGQALINDEFAQRGTGTGPIGHAES